MTELDKFTPEGTPIHPLDLFDLLSRDISLLFVEPVAESPSAIDEADYQRNRHKIGSVLRVKGKLYFETPNAPRTL